VDSVTAAWRQAHGGSDVLDTPLTIAGATHSRRLVPVATTLPSTTLRVTAPDTEDGLDRAEATVARGLAAGACLVAVEGGTALTRRLLCEAARLDHGAVTMLIEDANEDSDLEDRARTAILSGRADLVGVPA
jgi:anthraniloyl-CoA monooxygenase